MDLPTEIEDYIKESIEDSLGFPVSAQTLQLKLRASEDANRRLRDKYLLLLGKSRDKDQLIERTKAEANMNAVALKKFVEENQRLAAGYESLVSQCNKWEKECSLYDRDREALMDFGNEADERAKEAEFKVRELEEVLEKLSKELQFFKHQCEIQGAASSAKSDFDIEHSSLESILMTLISKEETEIGRAFLETNSESESCQELLKMWNSLRTSTQRVLSLVAQVNFLQKDKENLRINLMKAEDEVKLLSEANHILDVENKRLLKQQQRDLNRNGSNSVSSKGNKRKSSAKTSSPVDMNIDSTHIDSLRHPLSPLGQNSPECRKHKK
ncbi:hypothetical protein M5689_004945 [Euphorbia peplus]|nr:hypothetical protein M5689_004945 [Euphorbia peplus]